MITLEVQVSGDFVGRMLVRDAEELRYAFIAMIENAPDDIGKEIAMISPESDAEQIVEFLRLLADQIEAAV